MIQDVQEVVSTHVECVAQAVFKEAVNSRQTEKSLEEMENTIATCKW